MRLRTQHRANSVARRDRAPRRAAPSDMRPASFVVTWRDDARRGFQLHRRNNPSATTARTAATKAMSAPKIMSFRCRRRIAFYEVDMPRGIFARVSSSSRTRKAMRSWSTRLSSSRGPRRAAGGARHAVPRCGRRHRHRVWVCSRLPPHRDLLVRRPVLLPRRPGIAGPLNPRADLVALLEGHRPCGFVRHSI